MEYIELFIIIYLMEYAGCSTVSRNNSRGQIQLEFKSNYIIAITNILHPDK